MIIYFKLEMAKNMGLILIKNSTHELDN